MHDLKTNPLTGAATRFVRAGFVFGLTLITLLICWTVPEPKAGGEAGVVMQLPDEIGERYGHDQDVTQVELDILPKDTTYARKTYGLPGAEGADRILCSIILSGAERRSIHRPERCLPAQGWRIDDSHTETVDLASGHSLKVTALLLDRHVNLENGTPFTERQYYLYWFVGRGITTPSHTTRILMTYWDTLVHRINQRWAYVIVSKVITSDFEANGESKEQTLAELKQFIHEAVPTFMTSEMPEEKTAAK